MDALSAPQVGGVVDRYEVVGLLGQGGMATVYEVRHRDLGTAHALKLLSRESPGLRERLLFEGRAQARLTHPNVCRVSDVVRSGERLGLVMDLVRGPSLDELLREWTPNLLQLDWLADGILRGVHAAHEAGVVHRDLKPANVLLDVVGGQVVPRVSDFGIALDADADEAARRTREGMALGTPGYMAPEQFRDARSADRRSDVFALGALLYELATGTPAFFGDTPFACYEASSAGRFRPVGDLAPALPQRVRDAVTRALAPDPAQRFATADDLRLAWFEGAPPPSASAFEPSHVARLLARTPRGAAAPDTQSERTSPPPRPVRAAVATGPRRTWLAAVGVVGVAGLAAGVGTLALAAGLGAWWWTRAAAPVVATLAPEPAPAAVVVPAQPPPPAPATPPATPPAPAPTGAPGPTSRPAPLPVAPPPPAATAHVEITGIERAFLVRGDQRLRPGDIPPGTWQLLVFFDDGKATAVTDLVLAAGDRRTLRCDATLRVCR